MTNGGGRRKNRKTKLNGGCGDVCVGGGKKDFKLKFRINSNERARLITFGGKEKFIVGIIAVIFIFTSALKHAMEDNKNKTQGEKKGKNEEDSRKGGEEEEREEEEREEEGAVDKKSGLPHFIKRIIMPTV